MKIDQTEIGSNMDQNHLSNLAICKVISGHYLPEFTLKVNTKLKLGKVIIDSNFYQIDSTRLLEVISALYMSQLSMLT